MVLSKNDKWDVYYLSDKGKQLLLAALGVTDETGEA